MGVRGYDKTRLKKGGFRGGFHMKTQGGVLEGFNWENCPKRGFFLCFEGTGGGEIW